MTRWIEFFFKIQLPVVIMTILVLLTLNLALAQEVNVSKNAQKVIQQISDNSNEYGRHRDSAKEYLSNVIKKARLSGKSRKQVLWYIYDNAKDLFRYSIEERMKQWAVEQITVPKGRGSSPALGHLRSKELPSEIGIRLRQAKTNGLADTLASGLRRIENYQSSRIAREELVAIVNDTSATRAGRSEALEALTKLKHQDSKMLALYQSLVSQHIEELQKQANPTMSSSSIDDIFRAYSEHFFHSSSVALNLENIIQNGAPSRVMKNATEAYIKLIERGRIRNQGGRKGMQKFLVAQAIRISSYAFNEEEEDQPHLSLSSARSFVQKIDSANQSSWGQMALFELIQAENGEIRRAAARSLDLYDSVDSKFVAKLAVRYTEDSDPSVKKAIAKTLIRIVPRMKLTSEIQKARSNIKLKKAIKENAYDHNPDAITLASTLYADSWVYSMLLSAAEHRRGVVRQAAINGITNQLVMRWYSLRELDSHKDGIEILARSLGDEDRYVRKDAAIRLQYLIETKYADSETRKKAVALVSPGDLSALYSNRIQESRRSGSYISGGSNSLEKSAALLVKAVRFLEAFSGKRKSSPYDRYQSSESEVEEIIGLLDTLDVLHNIN